MRRLLAVLLALTMSVSGFNTAALAVDGDSTTGGAFGLAIDAGVIAVSGSSFFMEAGETVTVSALYRPEKASVAIGLLDSDGAFHYIDAAEGSVDITVTVDTSGEYYLAIANTSWQSISVMGFIAY